MIVPEKRSTFSHAWRGLFNLPHVGPNPGIFWVIFIIFLTGLAGIIRGGIIGFIGAIMLGCLIYIPMLIIGSIDRSKTSDRIERRRYERFEQALFE
jgi:hypothetical protein